jgi:predicted TPR repeat methyltransferase
MWEGIDISRDMLDLAASKEVEGGLMQFDMG